MHTSALSCAPCSHSSPEELMQSHKQGAAHGTVASILLSCTMRNVPVLCLTDSQHVLTEKFTLFGGSSSVFIAAVATLCRFPVARASPTA